MHCVQYCVRALHRDVLHVVVRHDLLALTFKCEGISIHALFSLCCLSVVINLATPFTSSASMIVLQALWALAAVQKSLVMGRKQAASAIMNTLKKHCTKPDNRKLYDQFPSLCDQLIRLCNHQPPAKAKYVPASFACHTEACGHCAIVAICTIMAIVHSWPLYCRGHCTMMAIVLFQSYVALQWVLLAFLAYKLQFI